MYQIAICDDDKMFCEQFKRNLDILVKKLNIKCNILVYHTAEALWSHLTNNQRMELIFLDIEFLKLDGVSLGRFIRERLFDYQIQLVYMSHEKNYAMQLFETEPMDFLVKPISADHIEKVLKRFQKQQSNFGKIFTFKEEYGNAQISYDSIWYFQSMNHKVIIHTANGERDFYGKLSEVEEIAPKYFIRIHKSFLVNEHFVSRFHYDKVILRNKQTLTISKTYRSAVQKRIRQAMEDNYCDYFHQN